jgi:hypothetical protein
MKKITLSIIAVLAFGFANAQEGNFKVGAHIGLPLGDIEETTSLNLGLDVAYLWKISDVFSVGATTGYTTYLAKEQTIDTGMGEVTYKGDSVGYIPLAATAQYSLTENLFVGADLGYAIYAGSEDGAEGGFLYQPKFGYQTEKIELYVGYKGISVDEATASSINLGFNYKF